jgi:hypothetical protein
VVKKFLAVALPLTFLLMALGATAARADMRNFPFTYQYATPDAGEREIELWARLNSTQALVNDVEFEYGLSDRIALSAYATFENLSRLDALRLEGRYRLAEAGEWPVDTSLYLEVEQSIGGPTNIEAKLLLEKTLADWVVDANLITERDVIGDPQNYNAGLGIGYALNETLKPGVEAVYNDHAFYAGPTLALYFGPTHGTIGAYYGADGAFRGILNLSQEF